MTKKIFKMQASGNDFIFIENFDGNLSLNLNKVRHLCHRKFGVGCDQLIAVNKVSLEGFAQIDVEIFNSDGSSATMCGNAMRCLGGKYLKNGQSASVKIKNGSDVRIHLDKDLCSVKMPTVYIDEDTKILSIGNKHTVEIVEDVGESSLSGVLPSVDYNRNFVKILDKSKIFVCTIERGVGLTLACGSGICASASYLHSIGEISGSLIEILTLGSEISNNLGFCDKVYVSIENCSPLHLVKNGLRMVSDANLIGGYCHLFNAEVDFL